MFCEPAAASARPYSGHRRPWWRSLLRGHLGRLPLAVS